MASRSWVTVVLLALNAMLLALLLVVRGARPARAQASEGQTDRVIAIAAPYGEQSLLYVVDTSREVILVYGFHSPGGTNRRDLRVAGFEFLAGRTYRWDVLLCSKVEYSQKGLGTLRGLRVTDSETQYKRLGK